MQSTDPALTYQRFTSLISDYAHALRQLDPQQLTDLFSPDGERNDPYAGPTQKGHHDIKDAYIRAFQGAASLKFDVGPLRISGNRVAFDFRSQMADAEGNITILDGIDVFTLSTDLKITHQTAYYEETDTTKIKKRSTSVRA